jgi:hypothetical protein
MYPSRNLSAYSSADNRRCASTSACSIAPCAQPLSGKILRKSSLIGTTLFPNRLWALEREEPARSRPGFLVSGRRWGTAS